MAKAKRKTRKAGEPKEPLINRFAARHGDYREAVVVDLSGELGGGRQKMAKVVRNVFPTLVDRWLAEGGPGFDEPQRLAIDHMRVLWHHAGDCGRLVANLDYVGGGGGGRERDKWSQIDALTQIAEYERQIPRAYWSVFEDIVRWNTGAAQAGANLDRHPATRIAAAKNCVGFVASLIAQWRGF